jgi:hypothetical protein
MPMAACRQPVSEDLFCATAQAGLTSCWIDVSRVKQCDASIKRGIHNREGGLTTNLATKVQGAETDLAHPEIAAAESCDFHVPPKLCPARRGHIIWVSDMPGQARRPSNRVKRQFFPDRQR